MELKDLKTILITGANRGIGLETARQLLKNQGVRVIAAVRNPGTADELFKLQREHTSRLEIDYMDMKNPETMEQLRDRLWEAKTNLDILINNAGIYNSGKNSITDPEEIMTVNYFGPRDLSLILEPQLKPDALIINVSSGMGALSGFSKEAAEELMDKNYNIDKLDDQVESYIQNGNPGWGNNPYSVSKAILNTLTRCAFAEGYNMVSVDPGWVQTDMGGESAERPVEKGAETIVWLALGNAADPGGKFYRDKKPIPF